MSDPLIIAVITLPLIALGVLAIVEVVRRNDLGPARSFGWIALLVVLPLLGLLAYIVLRPPRAVETTRDPSDETTATAVVQLAERRQRGEIGDEAYLSELTTLRSARSATH